MSKTPTQEEIETYLRQAFDIGEAFDEGVPLYAALACKIFSDYPEVDWGKDRLALRIAHDMWRSSSIEWAVENGEKFEI